MGRLEESENDLQMEMLRDGDVDETLIKEAVQVIDQIRGRCWRLISSVFQPDAAV
jgi:hypothetical protein